MNEDLKNGLQEQAKRVKSKVVRKYVNDVLMRKIDQAGEAAAIWIEKLETQVGNLKPVGAFKGWGDEDFEELGRVLAGGGEVKTGSDEMVARELGIIAKELVGFDEQDVELGELRGAVSFSPMFASGSSFIVSGRSDMEGIYKRNAYGAMTYRKIRIRDVYAEIGGSGEEGMEPFRYFTGSYNVLIQKLIGTGRFHHKVVT